MPYPQSPDFQGLTPIDGGVSYQPLFPNSNLFPGLEENEDQDFLPDVQVSVPSTRRYYAWPRRVVR